MIYYWWKCFFWIFYLLIFCVFILIEEFLFVFYSQFFVLLLQFFPVLFLLILWFILFFLFDFFRLLWLRFGRIRLPGSSGFLMIQSIVSKLRAWMKPKLFLSNDFVQNHKNWKRLNFELIEKEEIWRNLVEKKSDFFFENLHFWSEIEKLRCF